MVAIAIACRCTLQRFLTKKVDRVGIACRRPLTKVVATFLKTGPFGSDDDDHDDHEEKGNH